MKELKNLFVEQTDKTPLIDFNYLNGELILSGKSTFLSIMAVG